MYYLKIRVITDEFVYEEWVDYQWYLLNYKEE